MGTLAPHEDVARLHGNTSLSLATRDTDNRARVKYVMHLIRRLLIWSRFGLLYVAESKPLHRAFAPAVNITRSSNGYRVGDTRLYVNDL